VAGHKQEGIKSVASRAATAWQTPAELERGDAGLHIYHFRKSAPAAESIAAGDYHTVYEIAAWEGATLLSKQGIFAWDRIDDGSQLLLEQLPTALKGKDVSQLSALDLGCGYGLLALALAQAGVARVIATDNNAAAIAATTLNLAQFSPPEGVQVVLDDCASTLRERVDLLVCNPPFHQGFSVDSTLTDRFLAATKRLLKSKGQALFVVNGFIPLERKAEDSFKVETLANDRRFKVLRLTLPEASRKGR
jgi:16S rRNA (guanine1207-N2)-methyltransferase